MHLCKVHVLRGLVLGNKYLTSSHGIRRESRSNEVLKTVFLNAIVNRLGGCCASAMVMSVRRRRRQRWRPDTSLVKVTLSPVSIYNVPKQHHEAWEDGQ